MKKPAKVAKIVGAPGCGKTTEILRLVEAAAKKYGPDAVGAVSFTKAAVEEIRDRAAQSSGMAESAITNIRTIHSHCFRLLDLKMTDIADTHVKKFNERYPQYAVPTQVRDKIEDDPEETAGSRWTMTDNKRRWDLANQWRGRRLPISDWPDPTVVDWYDHWSRWMRVEGLTDFTGMVEQVLARELIPDIEVLFVDEAQDLSELEIRLMELWSEHVTSTVYVGDSSQCIYRWSGAVPEAFINLKNQWFRTLPQSYRVPVAVHALANTIIAQAADREDVAWAPTEVDGDVGRCSMPDLTLDGTHMILVRCNYMLNAWRAFLIRHGYVWHNPYRAGDLSLNPQKTKSWRAAVAFDRLRAGKDVSSADFKAMVALLPAKDFFERGAKTWLLHERPYKRGERIDFFDMPPMGFSMDNFMASTFDSALRLTGQARELLAALPTKKITASAHVILGTVHSVKGGEADHVWLDSRTSSMILRSLRSVPTAMYDEARVAYVAATRARQTFHTLAVRGLQNPALP